MTKTINRKQFLQKSALALSALCVPEIALSTSVSVDNVKTHTITKSNIKTLFEFDNCFEKLDISSFWKDARKALESSTKSGLHNFVYTQEDETDKVILICRENDGYWAFCLKKDNSFATYRFFDSIGKLKEKSIHTDFYSGLVWTDKVNSFDGVDEYDAKYIETFQKRITRYYNNSGKPTANTKYNKPFEFTYEQMFLFCTNKDSVLAQGLKADKWQKPVLCAHCRSWDELFNNHEGFYHKWEPRIWHRKDFRYKSGYGHHRGDYGFRSFVEKGTLGDKFYFAFKPTKCNDCGKTLEKTQS